MRLVGPNFQLVIEGDVDLDLPFRWEEEMPIRRKPGAGTIRTAILVDNPNDIAVPIPAIAGTPSNAIVTAFRLVAPVELPKETTGIRVVVEIDFAEAAHGDVATISDIDLAPPVS